MTEETRAAEWRAQQERRSTFQAWLSKTRRGSSAMVLGLVADWDPLTKAIQEWRTTDGREVTYPDLANGPRGERDEVDPGRP